MTPYPVHIGKESLTLLFSGYGEGRGQCALGYRKVFIPPFLELCGDVWSLSLSLWEQLRRCGRKGEGAGCIKQNFQRPGHWHHSGMLPFWICSNLMHCSSCVSSWYSSGQDCTYSFVVFFWTPCSVCPVYIIKYSNNPLLGNRSGF